MSASCEVDWHICWGVPHPVARLAKSVKKGVVLAEL